jgi:hypothetical protein
MKTDGVAASQNLARLLYLIPRAAAFPDQHRGFDIA